MNKFYSIKETEFGNDSLSHCYNCHMTFMWWSCDLVYIYQISSTGVHGDSGELNV
jgi:hypothetical protein